MSAGEAAGFPRVALIGLGLIASSMAHAMRAKGLCQEIVGYARSSETRAIALDLFCDRVTDSAASAVEGADLVVLAVPVGAMGQIAAEIAPHLKPGAVVTSLVALSSLQPVWSPIALSGASTVVLKRPANAGWSSRLR